MLWEGVEWLYKSLSALPDPISDAILLTKANHFFYKFRPISYGTCLYDKINPSDIAIFTS